jgi:hypothetical protein
VKLDFEPFLVRHCQKASAESVECLVAAEAEFLLGQGCHPDEDYRPAVACPGLAAR